MNNASPGHRLFEARAEQGLLQGKQQVTTLRGDIACRQYVDMKKNNSKNLYNYKQRFARILPLRGPCKPRAAARETTSNNASPWKHFQLICPGEAVSFHGTLSRHGKTRASSVLLMVYRKRCILLFTLQLDCNTRKACRLFKLFSLLSRPLFHPHSISSHIIARGRTAAHPIAQRGRREAITLHSETLTARRETKNPSRQGRAEGGRASQSNPKPSRRPSEAKATPSTPLQPSPKAKAKREGTRARTADEQRPTGRRLTGEG